ncbi:unnamed protein product [Bursaphelenchus okinawaensis]|uniref:SANT domain-containing protein n=1 Tax=Bursaphelenchus okinawaensis TaxID=465554 RepID=A0A811KCW8_9BILA|nr:unnamed protein product [Bursaphelenchus okinawaensis]CAG9100664.1 unnamed protein product [Bursaphelenchus okinawaensis]
MASLMNATQGQALQNLSQQQLYDILQNFSENQKRTAGAVALAQQQAAQQAQQQQQQRERELKEQREREQKQREREQQLKREQQLQNMMRMQQQANQKAAQQAQHTPTASASTANQNQTLQNFMMLLQQQQNNRQLQPNSLISQMGNSANQTLQLQQIQQFLTPNSLSTPQMFQQYQQALLRQSQQQAAATTRADEPRRPSLMSNLQQTPQSQLNLNLLNNEQKPSNLGSITTGVPLRPNTNYGIGVSAQTATTTTLNKPAEQKAMTSQQQGLEEKREKKDVRDKIDKTEADMKVIDAQYAATKKKREQLQALIRSRKEEMERERVEAEAEARAAAAKAAANAEAIRSRIPMIEKIESENLAIIEEKVKKMNLEIPSSAPSSSLTAINERYKVIRPFLIDQLRRKNAMQTKKMKEHEEAYEAKYQQWLKRVEKAEKAPKKVARDQKNRELFEKVFPEIKKEREDRERNERHERIQQAAEGIIKTKEEKVTERSCQVPLLALNREKFAFINNNNLISDDELSRTNEAISDFVDSWTEDEKKTFNDKIRIFGKNFHALSHFYWTKTATDMVKYYYATKSEMKYKNSYPKNKKKPNKLAKPIQMPEFRDMFDHLMETCSKPDIFTHICCIICDGDMKIFKTVPSMSTEKDKLYKKILKEQELRQKMPICTKCFGSFKKTAIRCPVGTCPGGKRKQKPSRAPPTEFYDQPLETQCAIVRQLRFHPATPKICSNCYKRIQQEIENIESNPYYRQVLPVPLSKRKPAWNIHRIHKLFDLVRELGREWLLISQRLAEPQHTFKPSPRQCRAIHERLRYFWLLKERRMMLQKQAKKISKQYRRIRRSNRHLKKEESVESDIIVIEEIKPNKSVENGMDRLDASSARLLKNEDIKPIIGIKRPLQENDIVPDSIKSQLEARIKGHLSGADMGCRGQTPVDINRMGSGQTAVDITHLMQPAEMFNSSSISGSYPYPGQYGHVKSDTKDANMDSKQNAEGKNFNMNNMSTPNIMQQHHNLMAGLASQNLPKSMVHNIPQSLVNHSVQNLAHGQNMAHSAHNLAHSAQNLVTSSGQPSQLSPVGAQKSTLSSKLDLNQLSKAIQQHFPRNLQLSNSPMGFMSAHGFNTSTEETIKLLLLHFKIPVTSPNWREQLEACLQKSTQQELALLQYRINGFRQSGYEEPKCITGIGIKCPVNGVVAMAQQQASTTVQSPPAKKMKEDRPVDENRPNRKSGLATAVLDQTKRPQAAQNAKQLAPPNNTHRPASTPLVEDSERKPLKQELANIQQARTPDPSLAMEVDVELNTRDVPKKVLSSTGLSTKIKQNTTENTAPIYEELSDSDSDQSRPPSANGTSQVVIEKNIKDWPPMVNMWNLEPEDLEKIRAVRVPLIKLPPIKYPEPGQLPSPPYEDLSD